MWYVADTEDHDFVDRQLIFPGHLDEKNIRYHQYCRRRFLQEMATLRLVNKSFSSSASAQLFKHVIATFNTTLGISSLDSLRAISNSSYGTYVRHLDLGFSIEDVHSTGSHERYVEEIGGLLPTLLTKLPNLSVLEVSGTPWDLPQGHRLMFTESIVSTLHYRPFSNLRELAITFPTTHDFSKLFLSDIDSEQTPIDDVLRNLRRLDLYVAAYKDRQQDPLPLVVLPKNAAYLDGSHTVHLLDLIKRACNLKSFALCSMAPLSFHDLKFHGSVRLESLRLEGVGMSSQKLVSLIKHFKDSLVRVQLFQVKIVSGTWQYVLTEASKTTRLLHFDVRESLIEMNNDVRLVNVSNHQDRVSLDESALGNLQRRVNGNRQTAGFPPVTRSIYTSTWRDNLEFEIKSLVSAGKMLPPTDPNYYPF